MDRVNISIFQQSPFILKATADFANGWRRNDKGYGFFGRGSIPWPGDNSLEITLNVRERPRHREPSFAVFPTDIAVTGDLLWKQGEQHGVFATKNGKGAIAVMLDPIREQLELNAGTKFYFQPIVFFRGSGSARIQMVGSISIDPSRPDPIGDIPEWDTQFFQGGLPSLGKRRP